MDDNTEQVSIKFGKKLFLKRDCVLEQDFGFASRFSSIKPSENSESVLTL